MSVHARDLMMHLHVRVGRSSQTEILRWQHVGRVALGELWLQAKQRQILWTSEYGLFIII